MPDPYSEQLARLHALEAVARSLQPGAAARQALLAAAGAYAQEFLERLPTLPGYVPEDETSRATLADLLPGELPADTDTALAALWTGVDRLGVNESAGHFFGFIPGASLHAGAVGDYLGAVTNRYTGVAYGAPGVARLQQAILGWIGRLVGFPPTATGDLTSGGSIANLIAVVTAREAGHLASGDIPRAAVYLTEQTHHSIVKALRVAGLAEAPTRYVSLDERHRMDVEALADAVDRDRAAGLKPWLVVATAGSTDTGAIDPLAGIAGLAAEAGMFFHVDAAYGGAFALTAEGRRKLTGIERADSLVIDPHKGLFIPFGSGVVLVKDGAAMRAAHGFEAGYLRDTRTEDGLVSPAEVSPELTRPNRLLRLWLPLKLHGIAPFRAALEEKLELARYCHARLGEITGIVAGPKPDLSVVTFQAADRTLRPDEAATQTLLERIQADGRIYLSSTRIRGKLTLRMAILNAATHRREVDLALDVIAEHIETF